MCLATDCYRISLSTEVMKEFPFELTEIEVKGLKILNNEISEEITKKLIVNAVKQLLVKGPGKIEDKS
jgi:hypothetical protein